MKDIGASCFQSSDSVKIYDMVLGKFHYLKPKGTITVTLDEEYNTYASFFFFCLEGCRNEKIRG